MWFAPTHDSNSATTFEMKIDFQTQNSFGEELNNIQIKRMK